MPVAVVCAGREGRFSLDDAVCAGTVVNAYSRESGHDIELSEAAAAAVLLAEAEGEDFVALFERVAAGRQLIDAGLSEDLPFCAQLDRHAIVPRFHDGQITL
jgi:2-phosphosulfolactate phosphatase